jgi:Anti-sigma-28 factor, FlgM
MSDRWGSDPMDPRPSGADIPHMTALDLRYLKHAGADAGRRFSRDADPSMDRTAKLEQLRDRIQSGTYEVDPKALATALLAHPATRSVLIPPPRG